MRWRAPLLAAAAAVALADASIVTLALPHVIAELDTSVEGAAAVIGVYTAVLAAAAWAAGSGRLGLPRRAAAAGGQGAPDGAVTNVAAPLAAFAVASAACGAAPSIAVLIVARAVQAAAAGVALVAIFGALRSAHPRWWGTAATLGIAAGPALGGLLTQGLDWRAVFLAQVPLLAAAALIARRTAAEPAAAPATPPAVRDRVPLAALGLVAAALTAVLFLLVLLLVSGWSYTPLEAAVIVSVLPLAAAAADLTRVGSDAARAAIGAALIGSGTLALATLPGDRLLWVVAAQVAAGAGMGLALPALNGRLNPERTPREAAGLLGVRHIAITLALAVLAPVASAQLDGAVRDTREQGAALVLDAALPPLEKIGLAGALVADVDPVDPRGELRRSLEDNAGRFADERERAAYAQLQERADAVLVSGVVGAFRPAFAVAGGLALAAALLLLARSTARRRVAALAAATLVLPLGLALAPAETPERVVIADPCRPRALPGTGGITGALQDAALIALDRAACRFGSSREELAIALADADAADAYEREHGVDPRSADLLRGIAGF